MTTQVIEVVEFRLKYFMYLSLCNSTTISVLYTYTITNSLNIAYLFLLNTYVYLTFTTPSQPNSFLVKK